VKFGHLIVGDVLGGDIAQLLGGVPEDVTSAWKGGINGTSRTRTSKCLRPWPLGVTAVPPPTAGLAMVWITRMALELRAHLVSHR
jgi:hypothetical protein